MGYTSVKAIPQVRGLVQYLVYGRGEARREHLAKGTDRLAVAFVEDEGIEEFVNRAERRAQENGRKIQAYSYVQSYPADLFDVNDPADLQRVHALGYALSKVMHPDSDVLVVTHADGRGGCAHNHLLVLNHVNTTGRAVTDYRLPAFVRGAENRLMDLEGLPKIDYEARRRAWLQRRLALGEGTFLRALGDVVHEGVLDPRSVDLPSLTSVLAEQEVELIHDAETDGITFKMLDDLTPGKRSRKRRAMGSRLAPEFTHAGLTETFKAKQAGVSMTALSDEALTPAQRFALLEHLGLYDAAHDHDDELSNQVYEYVAEHDPVLADDESEGWWETVLSRHGDDFLKARLAEGGEDASAALAAAGDDALLMRMEQAMGRSQLLRANLAAFDGEETPSTYAPAPVTDEPFAPAPDSPSRTTGHERQRASFAPAADARPSSPPAPGGSGGASAPAPGGSGGASAPAPVPVEAPYRSGLRDLRPKTDAAKKTLPLLAAYDEQMHDVLAAGGHVVEQEVPAGFSQKFLSQHGGKMHPALAQVLTKRAAKRLLKNEVFKAGREKQAQLDALGHVAVDLRTKSEQAELRQDLTVENRLHARILAEIEASDYAPVDVGAERARLKHEAQSRAVKAQALLDQAGPGNYELGD